MMKIKNILAFCIFSLAIVIFPVMAYAEHSDEPRVVDNVDILTDSQKEDLEEKLTSISEENDLDIVLFFESACPDGYEDDYGDDRAMYYCADLFDYGGYTDDGLALLITVDERKWALVTEGQGDVYFTSYVQDNIKEQILPYLKEDDFAGAADAYAEYVGYYFENLGSSDSTAYDTDYADDRSVYGDDSSLAYKWEEIDKFWLIIISLIIAAFPAVIRTAILYSQLTSVYSQQDAANYVVKDSMKLRSQMDTYLYTTVTRVQKSKNDDNDNSFTSSSGDTHTGSSGDF